jgi:hypothetical protein
MAVLCMSMSMLPNSNHVVHAALEGHPGRMFSLLDMMYANGAADGREADGRAWLLHGLHTCGVGDVGTGLLAYLVARYSVGSETWMNTGTADNCCGLRRNMDVTPYVSFCQTFADELSIQQCIARDTEVH